jgi:hypothetical protein
MTKTVLALAAALAVTSSTAALAQQHTYRGHRVLRTAPVQLSDPAPYRVRPWGGEPMSFGAGHAPGAFYEQEQPGYPQSPPGGGP